MRDRETVPAPADINRLAYSPTEAATAIGCSRQFIYDQLANGKLRSTTVGKRRFIRAADLDALLGGGDDPAA
jgi:excisionase family DNA binding protein